MKKLLWLVRFLLSALIGYACTCLVYHAGVEEGKRQATREFVLALRHRGFAGAEFRPEIQ